MFAVVAEEKGEVYSLDLYNVRLGSYSRSDTGLGSASWHQVSSLEDSFVIEVTGLFGSKVKSNLVICTQSDSQCRTSALK